MEKTVKVEKFFFLQYNLGFIKPTSARGCLNQFFYVLYRAVYKLYTITFIIYFFCFYCDRSETCRDEYNAWSTMEVKMVDNGNLKGSPNSWGFAQVI